MSTRTFSDLISLRNDLLHSKAIYRELNEHFSKFLDSDAVPAKIGIRSDGEGLVVPQAVIQSFLCNVVAKVSQIDKELHRVESLKVTDNVETYSEQEGTTENAVTDSETQSKSKSRSGNKRRSDQQSE